MRPSRIVAFTLCGMLSLSAWSLIGAQEATKAKGRLPANFGKLNLSEEQRDKIYGVQAEYAAQISTLEKQLADLRAKQTKAIEEVLTPEQLTKLTDLKAAAAKKKSAAKDSTTKPEPAPAADAPKTEAPKKPTTEKKPEAK